jgi:hypothetical protein
LKNGTADCVAGATVGAGVTFAVGLGVGFRVGAGVAAGASVDTSSVGCSWFLPINRSKRALNDSFQPPIRRRTIKRYGSDLSIAAARLLVLLNKSQDGGGVIFPNFLISDSCNHLLFLIERKLVLIVLILKQKEPYGLSITSTPISI